MVRKNFKHLTDDAEFYFLLVKIYWWSAMHVTGVYELRNQYSTTPNTLGETSTWINLNLIYWIMKLRIQYYLNGSDKRNPNAQTVLLVVNNNI